MADTPDYLKSLESILAAPEAPGTAPANTPTGAQPQLSLSTIGFGSMFKAADPAPDAKDRFPVLLVSTHAHQFTGYSKVSYGIISELAKQPWIKLTHFGFQKFHDIPSKFRPYPAGVDVIDAAALEKPLQTGFNYALLPEIIRKTKPKVVMIYNDLSVVANFMESIRKSGIPRTFKIWVYCDQVYTMQNQPFIDLLNRDVDRIFAFTAFWKKCLKDQGVTRPIDILHHGFNAQQVFPIPKELARRTVSLPQDIFLFLNLNRNQPRKRQDILIMAFAELVAKYPTKPLFLLCICDRGEKGGWWLFDIFSREMKMRGMNIETFGSRLMITTQNMSFRDEDINMFYNAADVGVTTADGEGWGLCQFEQMGVGVPQVVPDVGGFKEFCTKENSQIVTPKVRSYMPTTYCPVGGEAWACDPHDICLAMEEYVLNSDLREKHGAEAKKKVLEYTWEKACATLIRRCKDLQEDEDS